MPKLPPSIDPAAKISPTAIIDEYHPSLGTRVPPTVIEAGAAIVNGRLRFPNFDN